MARMATHLALLRGINVGGKNKVAMTDLREVVASLGHADVSTYIQSGNVLFTPGAGAGDADASALADGLAAAITATLGVRAPVVVISRDELAAAIAANPFADEPDPRRVHAVVLSGPLGADAAAKIDEAVARSDAKGARDELAIVGRALYLHTPDGFGNSELSAAVLRILASPRAGVTGTARNWATITKLLALCGDE
jgi:uncharacterized protein (DUF1697 family)